MLGAQALAADTIPGGSEITPGSGLSLPESPAPDATLPQSLPLAPGPGVPSTPGFAAGRPSPRPLTGRQRILLFWTDTYASPGPFLALSAGALVDQLRHTPAQWDLDGNGYTRRFASAYGQLAARNVIHEGLAGVTGLIRATLPANVPARSCGAATRSK